mgnify:CR=1 FL=1
MPKISYEKITSALMQDLPPRIQDIIVQRFGLQKKSPATLESIGRSQNITRERVRQIVEEGLRLLRKDSQRKRQAQLQNVFDYFTDTLRRAGSLKREDLLCELLSVRDAANHVLLLLTLGDQFYNQRETQEFYPFWSLKKEMVDQASLRHKKLLRFFEKQKAAFLEEELSRMYEKDVLSYLEFSKHIMQGHDGRWGLRMWPEVNPRGMREKAYLALKDSGQPLHFTDVAQAVVRLQEKLEGRNKTVLPQTVHNELIKDPRFVLVGRGTYGLKDWGLHKGTVKEIMHSILKGNGSSMTKKEIIEKTLSQRKVKESTIVLNLQDRRYFLRTNDGGYKCL